MINNILMPYFISLYWIYFSSEIFYISDDKHWIHGECNLQSFVVTCSNEIDIILLKLNVLKRKRERERERESPNYSGCQIC